MKSAAKVKMEGIRILWEEDLASRSSSLEVLKYIQENSYPTIIRLLIPSLLCFLFGVAEAVLCSKGLELRLLHGDAVIFLLSSSGFLVSIASIVHHRQQSQSHYQCKIFLILTSMIFLLALALFSVYVAIQVRENVLRMLGKQIKDSRSPVYSFYAFTSSVICCTILLCSMRIQMSTQEALTFLRRGVRPYERLLRRGYSIHRKSNHPHNYKVSTNLNYSTKTTTSNSETTQSTQSTPLPSPASSLPISLLTTNYGTSQADSLPSLSTSILSAPSATSQFAATSKGASGKRIRVLRSSMGGNTSSLMFSPDFIVGAKVLAQAHLGDSESELWFPGKISAIHKKDGTYDIVYDDGDMEFHKPRAEIELFRSLLEHQIHDKETEKASGVILMWKMGLFLHLLIAVAGTFLSIAASNVGMNNNIWINALAAVFDIGSDALTLYMSTVVFRALTVVQKAIDVIPNETKSLELCVCSIESILHVPLNPLSNPRVKDLHRLVF